MNITAYLETIELAFISSPVIASFQVVRFRAQADDGYVRIRARLINGDFLEAAAYVVLETTQIVTVDYRYQWMDSEKTTLHRRWDNTPDHPEIATFPHHVHMGSEDHVEPSQPVSLLDLLALLERSVGGPSGEN